ncbi:hypothetical protein D1871_16760 [Nakamurella silvestris]|nr:hypothetical protein D1871_16760 [Nakamurella silvestris]
MPDHHPTPTADDFERLRRMVEVHQRRFQTLARNVTHGWIVVTVATLLGGLLLPFMVPRNGEGRSANLWQMLSTDAPEVVQDAGGFWFIPLGATVLMIAVAMSFGSGATDGWWLGLRRVLTVAYFVGCLLGFAVLASYDEAPRPVSTPPALVVLTIGAAIAVALSFATTLKDLQAVPND